MNGTDDFNFSALPAGRQEIEYGGMGSSTVWWSATEISSSEGASSVFGIGYSGGRREGQMSVRCIKDSENLQKFTDSRDGKVYASVKIGNQTWMAENLNYAMEGSYCEEGRQEQKCKQYGRLYTYQAATKACPIGWHLPSQDEFAQLWEHAGGNNKAADARLAVEASWGRQGGPTWGTNDYGFSALPAGWYDAKYKRRMHASGATVFWTNQETTYYIGDYPKNYQKLTKRGINIGFSVRCLKD
jgi:uncharacterized protein (TIGR02145 family)